MIIIEKSVVYHYCSLETFMSIMENSTLRMADISKSNDYKEIVFCLDAFKEALYRACHNYDKLGNITYKEFYLNLNIEKVVENSISNDTLRFFASCFSEEPDLLSQWRGYANDASGVSIGINTMNFQKANDNHNFKFAKVSYSLNDVKHDLSKVIYKKFERSTQQYGANIQVSDYENDILDVTSAMLYNSVFYKSEAFREEREWRIVYYPFGRIRNLKSRDLFCRDSDTHALYYDRMLETLAGESKIADFRRHRAAFYNKGSNLVPYIDLGFENIKKDLIKEIYIGPKSLIGVVDLKLLLLSKGYDISRINIFHSNASYR